MEEGAWDSANSDPHPLAFFARTGDLDARRISEVIDEESWLQTELYQRCLRRLGLRFHPARPIALDASLVAALLFSRRGADFTLHDCELLNAFGPHFRQAWQRRESPWKDAGESGRAALRRFEERGLSPRGSEVLHWMTEGKQNRAIVTLLGLRLGTVQDHVASLLAKFGQENRNAATVHALGLLRSG